MTPPGLTCVPLRCGYVSEGLFQKIILLRRAFPLRMHASPPSLIHRGPPSRFDDLSSPLCLIIYGYY